MDIKDTRVAQVVSDLERRADRQESEPILYSTYVDCGVLAQLSNTESQVIFGRRGVGKSHLLHFHRHQTGDLPHRTRYFIFDCRTLGSGNATLSPDPKIVARNYACEIFTRIGNELFDSVDALELTSTARDNALEAAYQMSTHIMRPDGRFDYTNINSTINAFCHHTKLDKIFIGLDEYIEIPQSAQAYVAEHIKLAFGANRKIILKIAAVTFQTSLSLVENGESIGLELGADVFTGIDLDSYFIWDENPGRVEGFLAEVLYNHIADGVSWRSDARGPQKYEIFTNAFFTQEKAFTEMARASEGNCRDLMNIFKIAYFNCYRDPEARRISKKHVEDAAIDFYRQAKLGNISSRHKDVEFLNFLIQDVIRGRRSRGFMVYYGHANHPLLLRLLNLRLLHRLRTSWTHPDKPGEPYHIFVMDYGCYAELKGTQAEPQQTLIFDTAATNEGIVDLVPLTDRKSIRRIILTEDQLKQFE